MPEKICITPRCVFCQFEIDDGDDVAIDVGGSWQHKTTGQPATQLICDDLDCPHLQYGCHSYCLRVVGFDRSREFIEATKHSYIPTEQEESRRRRWIRHCLTLVLSKKYADEGLHLTPELCLLIADHLLQVYSVVKARSLWSPDRRLRGSVTTTRSIWYGFVEFEGTEYVSSLSNARSEHTWKLIRPHQDRYESLLIAENYLGITKLLLAGSRDTLAIDESPGIWWRTIRLCGRELTINVESDGIKLRRLTVQQQGSIAWNVPEPSRVRFHHFTSVAGGINVAPEQQQEEHAGLSCSEKTPARMNSFKCNGPTTTGYSVFWASGLALFHAHIDGEDMSFYRSASHASWLYMPIDPDEVITEIWQRKAWVPRERAVGFKTNKGRTFIAGAYLKQSLPPKPFELVERLGQETGRMFYEDTSNGIGALAFARSKAEWESLPPFLCPQPTHNRVFVATEDFFFSSHRLEGLAEIIPCVIKNGAGIAGMLLRFSNGHRESVGQVRLDSLGPSTIVNKPSWFLGFGRMHGIYPYVTALGTTLSKVERDSDLVMQLFCDGAIEWIWSRRQCLVMYKGQRSYETV